MQLTNDQIQDDHYFPGKELFAAINTALLLERPLLLSGEPGTGKTECAGFLARRLHQIYKEQFKYPSALRFNTKSVSQFSDLFYNYDIVSHFADKTGLKRKEEFISFNTLGAAILATREPIPGFDLFKNYRRDVLEKNLPFSSVVQIDEIDKAPRDFPNDLLAELERPPFSFRIKDHDDLKVEQDAAYPVIIIITTNNEKGLPDAFLRRCVFHHINFPAKENLMKIIKMKLGSESPFIADAVELFLEIRKLNTEKKPATSELIDWIKCLKEKGLLNEQLKNIKNGTSEQRQEVNNTISSLAKSKADVDAISF